MAMLAGACWYNAGAETRGLLREAKPPPNGGRGRASSRRPLASAPLSHGVSYPSPFMFATASRIFRFRNLLLTLTLRELKARYRGSALGYLWSLINPLLLLAVYSFVFGVAFKPAARGGSDPYALFLVTGLFPWIWTATSLNEATVSLQTHAGLIKKAVFPAELLPLISVAANGLHFLLALPIVGGALLVGRALGYPVGGWAALLLPVVVLLQAVLLSGLGLGLSAVNALFKDVKDILANVLTLTFFLTPILYTLSAVPYENLVRAISWNPFTPFTLAYQELLFAGRVPGFFLWGQMVLLAALAWFAGSWLFERLRETLVEAV